MPIRSIGGVDVFWWSHTRVGVYTVKYGYQVIREMERPARLGPSASMGISPGVWKIIWGLKVPQKLKHFLWKACNNILPVRENLRKRRVVPTTECTICNKEVESVKLALLFCEWTRPVWFGNPLQLVPTRIGTSTISTWLVNRVEEFKVFPEFRDSALISIVCSLWMIWKGRNQVVFEGKSPNPMAVI